MDIPKEEMPYSNTNCITTVASQFSPYTLVLGKPPKIRVSGIMIQVVEELGKKFHLCFNHVGITGQGYGGKKMPNGTYTGLLGDIQSNTAQMSVTPLKLSGDRAADFHYSPPISMSPMTALIKYPRIEPDLSAFVKVFNYKVWIVLAVVLAFVSVAMFLQHKFYQRLLQLNNSGDSGNPRNLTSIYFTLLFAIQILLCQATKSKSLHSSASFTVGLWIMVSFIVVLAYKENLKAMLIIPKLSVPFSNIQEMVNQDEVKWAVAKGTVFSEIVAEAKEGTIFNKFYQRINYVSTVKEMYAKVQTGKYTFVTVGVGILGLINLSFEKNGRCEQTKMKDDFLFDSVVVIYNKNFPLVKEFNRGFRNMKQFGIIDYLMDKATRNASKCITKIGANNEMRPLSITDYYGVLFLYVSGLVISVVAFMIEVTVGYFNESQEI